MITFIFLKENQTHNLERCLNSIFKVSDKIIIGYEKIDLESLKICENYGCILIELQSKTHAEAKNHLMEDCEGWMLWIEPWEELLEGHDELNSITSGIAEIYRIQILQSKIISKPIRLWHSTMQCKWQNPVFESVTGSSKQSQILFKSIEKPNTDHQQKIIERWKLEHPESSEPYYYEACNLLYKSKYKEFETAASRYLFHDQSSISSFMIRYYLAAVQLHFLDKPKESAKNIVTCIGKMPMMAEFWCLYADIAFKLKQFNKAKSLYENAIIAGERRETNDEWPIELLKYKTYPKNMIKRCEDTLTNVRGYKLLSNS